MSIFRKNIVIALEPSFMDRFKCPNSGIQVGSVLPKGPIYWLGLASDANFICAVATMQLLPYLMLHFSVEKKHTPKFTYRLLKSSVYIINQIRDLTNSYDMPRSRSQWQFLEKTCEVWQYLDEFWVWGSRANVKVTVAIFRKTLLLL